MNNPIVCIITPDKLELYGILLPTGSKDVIIINIHDFYDNNFVWEIAKDTPMLSVNNRGSYSLELYDYGHGISRNSGAATEIFSECVIDIDAWIKYALSLGYKKVILMGHSLGTEKIVYYLSKGKLRDKVKAIILLGFSDSFGTHLKYLKKLQTNPLAEAKALIKQGKQNQLLAKHWLAHAGVLPQSAKSYVDFFGDDSELARALPLRQGRDLTMYQNISVPILGVIGDQEEYTVIPIARAIELLKRENKLAKIYQIKNCDHIFSGKEKTLAMIVKKFILL